MALMKCPECGQNVSDTASICVHCGFALKEGATVTPTTVESVAAAKSVEVKEEKRDDFAPILALKDSWLSRGKKQMMIILSVALTCVSIFAVVFIIGVWKTAKTFDTRYLTLMCFGFITIACSQCFGEVLDYICKKKDIADLMPIERTVLRAFAKQNTTSIKADKFIGCVLRATYDLETVELENKRLAFKIVHWIANIIFEVALALILRNVLADIVLTSGEMKDVFAMLMDEELGYLIFTVVMYIVNVVCAKMANDNKKYMEWVSAMAYNPL